MTREPILIRWSGPMGILLSLITLLGTWLYGEGQKAALLKEIDNIKQNGTILSQKNTWQIEQQQREIEVQRIKGEAQQGSISKIEIQVSVLGTKLDTQDKKMDEILDILKNNHK
jgi:hypothetical protein